MTFLKPPCPNGTVITMVSWKQGCATRHHHTDENWSCFVPGDDFGDDFGAHWILEVAPKSIVEENQNKNEKQNGPRNVWKILVFDWFWIPNWEDLISTSELLAEDMLQNNNVRGVMKYWENWCPNGYPKRSTSEPTRFRYHSLRFGRDFWEAEI